jgi:hypothetical protein
MYERSYGYKYGEGGKLDTAAIAKLIRQDIKTAVSEGLLPARWAYSVRTDRFSGGSSIDVEVKNCADAWMPCPGYKVGTRRDLDNGGWVATGCGNPWCKVSNPDKAGAEEDHTVLTEEALAAHMTLERIHNAYNHDGSEVMVDYFDVNYYGVVGFQSLQSARWEAEEKARKQARKDAMAAATETCRVKVYGRQGQTVHTAAKVEGKLRLVCGAQLWRSSLYSKTDEPVTCSRCKKKAR